MKKTKKLNSIVCYFRQTMGRVGEPKAILEYEHPTKGLDFAGFVRVEYHPGKNCLDALYAAKPRRGETVMNSHEI